MGRTINETGPVGHKHRPSLYGLRNKSNSRFFKIHRGSEMKGRWEGCLHLLVSLGQRSSSPGSQRLDNFHSFPLFRGRQSFLKCLTTNPSKNRIPHFPPNPWHVCLLGLDGTEQRNVWKMKTDASHLAWQMVERRSLESSVFSFPLILLILDNNNVNSLYVPRGMNECKYANCKSRQ